MISISKISRLSDKDSGLHLAIVRMNNGLIDSKRKDVTKFYRRTAVLIKNNVTGDKTIRFAMGAGQEVGITRETIALDYDAIDALNIKRNSDISVTMRKATDFELYHYYWTHSDLSIRLSMRLGFIGVLLGATGLLISLISLAG